MDSDQATFMQSINDVATKTEMDRESEPPSCSGRAAAFSLRIVTLDYYMASPHPELDACYSSLLGQPIAEVPIVRIFGTTLAGQKTCLHLHKVFPYFYVPYDDDLPQDMSHAWAFIRSMASAIEKALKLASTVGAKRQHVYGCSLVRGRHFYGFHREEQLFVKIQLYYPQEVSRLSTLLLGGGILNRRFQPYESHIPFLLQVLVDHNLAGMGHMHLSDVKFRQPVLKNQFLEICTSKSSLENLLPSLAKYTVSSGSSTFEAPSSIGNIMGAWCRTVENAGAQITLPAKQSTCELEGDTCVKAILNQLQLSYVPLEKAAPDAKMVPSLIPIWDELNGTKSTDLLRKERNMPSENYGHVLRYKEKFNEMLKKFDEVYAGSVRDISADKYSTEYAEGDSNLNQEPNLKSNALLSCTQAAHSKNSLIEKYHEGHESRTQSVDSIENIEEGVLLNEELIKHQLSQSSQQDTDEEAVELFKWMISSQQDENSAGYSSDCEKLEDDMPWSQVFQCADKALAKALSDYEVCSQQQCQEIIDCLEGENNGSAGQFDGYHNIPQVDGSFDEDMHGEIVPEVCLSQHEEAGNCGVNQSPLIDSEQIVRASDKTTEKWGPVSMKRSMSHNSTGELEHLVTDFNEGEPRISQRHSKEEIVVSLDLSENSVRDLMRSKRSRRQQIYASKAEKSGTLPATSNFNINSRSLNKIDLAKMNASTSSSEKQPEPRDHSLRYGPLPFQRPNPLANSYEIEAAFEGDFDADRRPNLSAKSSGIEATFEGAIKAKCCTSQNEVHNNECPASTRSEVRSTDNPKAIGCANFVEKDVFDVSCTAVNRLENSEVVEERERLSPLVSSTNNTNLQSVRDTGLYPNMTNTPSNPCNFVFRKKPPTVEHLLNTFRSYGLFSFNLGKVFYGNAEDLPSEPSVMAGMLFKVQSGGVDALSPFQFGNDLRGETQPSMYMSEKTWKPSNENNFEILPSHFCNDGTPLYLLSPVKLPPRAADVHGWLRKAKLEKGHSKQNNTVCKQTENSTEASWDTFIQDFGATKPSQVLKPSSPKYDEAYLLPHSPEQVIDTLPLGSICQPSSRTTKASATIFNGNESKESSKPKVNISMGAVPERPYVRGETSQISGPTASDSHFTPLSQAGFRDPASTGHGQQISVMSVEAFACTRGDLRPDPRYDAIRCIVMVLQNDVNDSQLPTSHTLLLVYDESKDHETFRNLDVLIGCKMVTVRDETSLLQLFTWFVRMYDPDMLVGWEVQGYSLGFLAERAANLGIGLLREISRLPMSRSLSQAMGSLLGKATKTDLLGAEKVVQPSIIEDEWGRTHGSGIHVDGRIVLNLWRIMHNEIKLGIYTLEAVAEAVLKRKVPLVSWRTLTMWFTSGSGLHRHLCLEYQVNRAVLNLQIMDQLDLVNRTSELARVFGIDFFSVLSRGSQYRVESMMLRVAHSQNFLLISPSRQQVAGQPAMQCLPLVMEPESRFYTDPVIVLDFQSLYPSMMIAYNLCYSTCLGKVVVDNPKVLGVTSINLNITHLKDLKDWLTFTPNGVMFISAKVCPGVLPRLLEEILSTRILVKQSMKKLLPSQKVLERVLNARQLALKLIANVTYGYTAAGFSGRMPCAELADSIVQSGRHTLETAINYVNNSTKWNAKVVYGDTDSMFVLVKGHTKLEAFKIGEEIAEAITGLNPHPVTLKMEKVYHPCVLLTKKRYVGYSYENPEQMTPKFDAKGIETVRRDSCSAVSKTLEKSLRILFESHDISQVKAYLTRQWGKIICGRVSLQDFIFAKEVRLGTYSARSSVLPPAAIVATKAMAIDPRAEPHYGERIPYVVVHGEPGARLVDMVVNPHMLVNSSSSFRLHDVYYITKQIIPALQRVFGLIGVDLRAWYNAMPRVFRPSSTKRSMFMFQSSKYLPNHLNDEFEADAARRKPSINTRTIDLYYLSQHCVVCGETIVGSSLVCKNCQASKDLIAASLLGRFSCLEKQFKHLLSICRHCGGGNEQDLEDGLGCISLACSVFYERIKVQKECRAAAIAASQCGLINLHLH